MINPAHLLDPLALGIVTGGVALGTLARSGWRESALSLREAARLLRKERDPLETRAELANCARAIRRDGLLRARLAHPKSPVFGHLTRKLVRERSIAAMREEFRRMRGARDQAVARAVANFDAAGDLAPVFGLVGTLFGITRIEPLVASGFGAVMASLSTAVLSTLYGVLLAHLVCFPIARRIERRARREAEASERLLTWFAGEIEAECPALRAKELRVA